MSRTLQDAAESWARARHLPVPPRGTPAWQGMFMAWQRGGMSPNPLHTVPLRPSMSFMLTPEAALARANELARSNKGAVFSGEPVAVFETKPRLEKFMMQVGQATGSGDVARFPRLANKSDGGLERFSEIGGTSEASFGDLVSERTRPVLQVLSQGFGGGRAFTRDELAHEAVSIRGAQGQHLSPGSIGVRVGHALSELEKRGYVERIGKELNRQGRPGPMRFTLTKTGEERAMAGQEAADFAFGENVVEQQIARLEAAAPPPARAPLSGAVYRPSLHIQETRGHKLPPLQAGRVRAAGYRTCNPNDEELRALERLAEQGDPTAFARVVAEYRRRHPELDPYARLSRELAARVHRAIFPGRGRGSNPRPFVVGELAFTEFTIPGPVPLMAGTAVTIREVVRQRGSPTRVLVFSHNPAWSSFGKSYWVDASALTNLGPERYENPRRKAGLVQIVLGRVEQELVPEGEWRADLGERPKMRPVPVARVLMWKRDGSDADIEAAHAFATREGYQVLTFPPSGKDPLGAARAKLLRGANPTGSPLSGPIHESASGLEFITYRPGGSRRPRLKIHPEDEAVLVQGEADELRALLSRRGNPARSKKCQMGFHDFEPATGLCRRSGCQAYHHAGQASMFGRDLDPTAVREALERERLTGQRDFFARPNPLTGIEASKVLDRAARELLSLHPSSSQASRLESAATAYEDAAIVQQFGPRLMHGNAARLQADAGRVLYAAQDHFRGVKAIPLGSIPTPNPLTVAESKKFLAEAAQLRHLAGQRLVRARKTHSPIQLASAAHDFGQAEGLAQAVRYGGPRNRSMEGPAQWGLIKAGRGDYRAIDLAHNLEQSGAWPRLVGPGLSGPWSPRLPGEKNPITDARDTGGPLLFATVTGKKDRQLAGHFGTDIGRGRFAFTREAWAALMLARRMPNPLSVLLLGNSPPGVAAHTGGRPRAARAPNAPRERGSIPPAGTLGLEAVRKHCLMFHGAPVATWKTVDIEDGRPGVTHEAATALGVTEATVYSAPWRKSNKHKGGVYEHVHETHKPIEAYRPASHTTIKVLPDGAGPSDWWRDDEDPRDQLPQTRSAHKTRRRTA